MVKEGRTVSSLQGAKMLKRTLGHRLGIKVAVKGSRSIREAKPMLRILRALVADKAWVIKGIRNLESLEEIHQSISLANNILCDILRFTAPNFNAAGAAPPCSGPATGRRATPDDLRDGTSSVRTGRRAASDDIRTGRRATPGELRAGPSSVPTGRRAASSAVPVGGQPSGGHVGTASANVFNVREFGKRLRDSGSVQRDLQLGSPEVRLPVSLLGVQIHDAGQALMLEGRATHALREQLKDAKDEVISVWDDQTILF